MVILQHVCMMQSIELAIQAFRLLAKHEEMKQDAAGVGCKLVIAGGYDPRLAENREYLEELKALASDLGLSEQVLCTLEFVMSSHNYYDS